MNLKKSIQNIETDSFDRELFSEIEAESKEFKKLIKAGSHLLPHFRSLVLDIFAAFYKYNVIVFSEDRVRKSVFINRRFIQEALGSKTFAILKEESILDKFNSALATLTMGEELIRWIKSDEGLTERTLLKEWELDSSEERYEELLEEKRTWEELTEKDPSSESLKEGKKKANFELSRIEGELNDLEKAQKEKIEKADIRLKNTVDHGLKEASQRTEEAETELMEWGASIGMPEEKPIGKKLDLAGVLFKNEKVRRLALMVGSLKEEMFSARRKVWSKRGSEVFDIALGAELGRIIPAELVSLRHRFLRRDFLKRFIERRLLQYYLKEERGRGPLIVCLDGSSSMQGDKEMWSKAVCLSLLEIARRQRRKFSVIVFSSKGTPLRIFESGMKENWYLGEEDIIQLAEYFPGGGTDFEYPLDETLKKLRESKFKRGDIVFITDGECDVSQDWLSTFQKEKKHLNFEVFSVLIDLGGSTKLDSLKKFSDKVTSVSKLTSEGARGIFVEL